MSSDGGHAEKPAPPSAPRRFFRKGNGRDSDLKDPARSSSDEKPKSSGDVALPGKPAQNALSPVSMRALFRCVPLHSLLILHSHDSMPLDTTLGQRLSSIA